MKPQECQIGTPVTMIVNPTFFQWMKHEGIISGLREEITFEKGRKQYTMEFGKRKAIYPQIKMVAQCATVILTDGRIVDVNIKDLITKYLHHRCP